MKFRIDVQTGIRLHDRYSLIFNTDGPVKGYWRLDDVNGQQPITKEQWDDIAQHCKDLRSVPENSDWGSGSQYVVPELRIARGRK